MITVATILGYMSVIVILGRISIVSGEASKATNNETVRDMGVNVVAAGEGVVGVAKIVADFMRGS